MRKTYPYLIDADSPTLDSFRTKPTYLEESYTPNLNFEQEKKYFLAKIDDFPNQKQYINMTLLTWKEDPIKSIDGVISSGTISKDGNSSVRHTCNLNCSVDGGKYNADDIKMDFALNKKVFIEIGVENQTDEYPEYPILWFPQGIFYINSFAMNSATSSAVNLSLQLKDKMCLLNGDIGGVLPSTVQFDIMTTQLADGTITEQKVLYYNIITELVHHWGGEELSNIIIQDVPLRIRKIMQWNAENPIYLTSVDSLEDGGEGYFISFEELEGYNKYEQGDNIGYVYADFVPVSEITGAAGDNICTILDTIKEQLGNYEYFYDVFGIFHFREIKNYLNITQANTILQESGNLGRHINLEEGQFQLDTGSEIQYLIDTTNEKTSFSFSDNKNITSITVTPNYNNIKNDFVVDGVKESTNKDIQYSVRYRLVIDEKPSPTCYTNITHDEEVKIKNQNAIPAYGKFDNLIYYTYPEQYEGQTVLETNRLGCYTEYSVQYYEIDNNPESSSYGEYKLDNKGNKIPDGAPVLELPTVGNMDQIYHIIGDTGDEYWIWTGLGYTQLYLKNDEDLNDPNAEQFMVEKYNHYFPIDWRTFLYCYGLQANANGTDPGPYFQDLDAFWPLEYNLRREKQCFFGESEDKNVQYKTLTQGNFYFDMIDASFSSLGEYSVENIGRRVDVYSNKDVNCLFEPEIPNVVFLNMDNPRENWSENTTVAELKGISSDKDILEAQKRECNLNGQPWVQVSSDIFNSLITGGYLNSAYDAIRYELFSHTTYQKVISLTALPAFYLEPNSRVEIIDHSTNTYGDFMIQTINLTLGPGANMAITANEIVEKI